MKAVSDAKTLLARAVEEADAKRRELERVEKLTALYPDLERHTGRWNRVVYCSSLANETVTDVFTRYNCGCCSDTPFEAWPYLKTEHGDVYSKPACFMVGEQHPVSGARPNRGWQESLRNSKISQVVIDRLASRFEFDRQQRIADASREEEADDEPDPLV